MNQAAYLLIEVSKECWICSWDVVAITLATKSFSILEVSSKMFSSGYIFLSWLSNGRTSSCGTIPLLEVGSCVIVFTMIFMYVLCGILVLPWVGSCVTTLGPMIF